MSNVTLATLHEATPQQVFDHVVAYAKERMKVVEPEANVPCEYRNQSGGACFAGSLMTEQEWETLLDGTSPWASGGRNSRAWESLVSDDLVPYEHHRLISKLQEAHDWQKPMNWLGNLKNVGMLFGLDVSACE